MNPKTIGLFVGGLIVIILGMFTFAFFKKADIEKEPLPEIPQEEEQTYGGVERIDAKHFFIDGVHTIAGEIMMPTPCDLLEADALVRESYPEQVTVSLEIINNSEMCTQVITPQRFKVSFTASEEAMIDATLEGKPVTLNLVPAGEGETPDAFELYIKG